MLRRLLTAMAWLVGLGGHDRAVLDDPDDAPSNRRALDPSPAGPFNDLVAQTLLARNHVVAGSLELVGLDDVRDILGEGWTAVSLRVAELAEREIELCLDAEDIFRPYGDATYLIHFDRLDKGAAEQKAKRIALRVKATLVDEIPEVAQAISIRHFVAEVEPASLPSGDFSLADKLFVRLTSMRKEAERSARRDRRKLHKDFQVLFSPVWNAQIEAIVLNRCLLDTSYSGYTVPQLLELAGPGEAATTSAELDYLTLAKSLEALHQLLKAGHSAMMLVPVDFRTIHNKATVAEYMRLLSAAPSGYTRCLALEINGAAPAYPPDRLWEIARRLASCVGHVAVELQLDDPRTSAMASLGVWAVSIDLAGLSGADPRLPAQLRQFTAAANGVNTLARGASSMGLAVAASEAGFTYVDGAGIHLPVREPRPPRRLRPLPRTVSFGRSLDFRPAIVSPGSHMAAAEVRR